MIDSTRDPGPGTLTYRLLHDFLDVPPLPLGKRPGLFDHHAVADVEVGSLVVREELARPLDVLLISAVLREVLHADDHGLVHLVRDDHADLGLRSRLLLFLLSHRLTPSTSRSTTF